MCVCVFTLEYLLGTCIKPRCKCIPLVYNEGFPSKLCVCLDELNCKLAEPSVSTAWKFFSPLNQPFFFSLNKLNNQSLNFKK